VIDSAFGPLRGRSNHGLKPGDEAILFIRPEALLLADGAAEGENVVESAVVSESFEGSFVHIFLAGDRGRNLALSLTNDGTVPTLNQGEPARVAFQPERAVVLPVGELASD